MTDIEKMKAAKREKIMAIFGIIFVISTAASTAKENTPFEDNDGSLSGTLC